jgi:hypothetical protein
VIASQRNRDVRLTMYWARSRAVLGALKRGLVAANPRERGGRLYRGSRTDKIWTTDDEAAFMKTAPKHLYLPLLLAALTRIVDGVETRRPLASDPVGL